MSQPVPSHLEPEVAALERGEMADDTDRKVRLYADLIVADAVPYKDAADVARFIQDGWLSPSGDVTRYDNETFYY